MSSARKVIAIIMGFILASAFAERLAITVTSDINKFLFLDSITANKFSIWLLVFTYVTMSIGTFSGTKVEKICGWGSGLSLSFLYVQYCRNVEQMKHYIIFSIIFFVVCAVMVAFFEEKKDKWNCGLFFSGEFVVMLLWPIGFLIYAFFNRFIGLSGSFCLVVISVVSFIITILGINGMLND